MATNTMKKQDVESRIYEIKPAGNGGHVILPKQLVGKKIRISFVKKEYREYPV